MFRLSPRANALVASAALALLLAACGGGGADTTPRTQATTLRVMGDSLADVGTFGGVKATVQGNDMYPERISELYGLGKGCSFFAFTGTTFVPDPRAGCTNYAIGGGVINAAASGLSAADPRGIPVQFAAATAAGNFAAGDLLLVDGGGNDAAALVGAYLAIPRDGGASYTALLGTLLTPQQVQAAAAGGAAGLAAAGGTYMTALAASFHTLIQTQALDKGAQRIVLLNMPGITNTPRFQLVLDGIAAASGANGATARAQSEGLFKSWVEAFNAELARRFAGNGRVAIVDFYKAFNDQVATPAQYGLTNVKDTACPATGVGSDGLPSYSFPTCTDASLAADPRAAGNANWYKSWAFSDGFHPTPYGHQLLAQLIAKTLASAGWL
jgi:phospholipase/lecithinase/hemolysin